MKFKGLTRGEILLGMEQGIYIAGDYFKEVSDTGVGALAKIIADEPNETCLVWESSEEPLQLRNCLTEKWDVIEKPFEIGEWITLISRNIVISGRIIEEKPADYITDYDANIGVNQWFDKHLVRKATPDEIEQEKRRRVFAKVGRKVNEFKTGDIGTGEAGDLLEVENVDELLYCKQFHPTYQNFERFNVDKNSMKLVVPVEKRLDK
ncbi:TPA: hypothetical protein QCX65_005013 [Bacillus mycoides]|nr:hypothetical protein [Bacillus mycoides]